MKKFLMGASLLAGIMLAVACSSVSEDGPQVSEIINDVLKSEEDFDFDTLTSVEIRMLVRTGSGAPIQGALVTVRNASGQDISYGFSDQQGLALFDVTIPNATGEATIDVTHPQMAGYGTTVTDLASYEKIDRDITVAKGIPNPVIEDRDHDGVPDEDDDFPDDSRYAKSIKAEYTLVFEDLYPVKGDADFNDAVTRLNIEEKINVSNQVAAVIVRAQALASGAGYDNRLLINILGREYPLILSYKDDLAGRFNSKTNDSDSVYVPSSLVHTNELLLDPPVMRYEIQPMPYDPFILPDGNDEIRFDEEGLRFEVHLPFVNTDYTGVLIDEDGFPWAMVVPMDFLWPYERVFITNAYPKFTTWYESNGKQDADWYNYPVDGQVYSR